MRKHFTLQRFFEASRFILMFLAIGANAQKAQIWLTRGDESSKLEKQAEVVFSKTSGKSKNTIYINEKTTYQTVDGFGFALTQGSAEALSVLKGEFQNKLLLELFDPINGINISVLRISLGASDLGRYAYSYNEVEGDIEMKNFSLEGLDKTYVIPMLKKIIAINPDIKIMASPWSAPTWMKTNKAWIGGSLREDRYKAYANYFLAYLEAMKKAGISIWAITPQNEPEHPGNEPSMLMSSDEQIDFINNHLGPAIKKTGLATKIIAYDHNCDNTSYPINVLNNSSFVDGAAFHLYAGDISAMSEVRNTTGKNVYFTEQYTNINGDFSKDLVWQIENIIIGSLRNWSRTAIGWNLASDASFGPHTPGGCTVCLGAITVKSSSEFTRNVPYYIISHASAFIKPGAVRIETNDLESLKNVAMMNPDGSKVLLVCNTSDITKKFGVTNNGSSFEYNLPGNSVVTFRWTTEETSITNN